MKKGLLLLCALALLVLSCAHAETEFVIPCGGQPALTLRYDENVYTLDRESYLSSSFGAHTWLGMFYDGHSAPSLRTRAASRWKSTRRPRGSPSSSCR